MLTCIDIWFCFCLMKRDISPMGHIFFFRFCIIKNMTSLKFWQQSGPRRRCLLLAGPGYARPSYQIISAERPKRASLAKLFQEKKSQTIFFRTNATPVTAVRRRCLALPLLRLQRQCTTVPLRHVPVLTLPIAQYKNSSRCSCSVLQFTPKHRVSTFLLV